MVALLLAVSGSPSPGGRLYVHVPMQGLQVLVDGNVAGTTSNVDGGALLKGIAAGPHHIIVRTPDGREAAFNVKIAEGLQTEINVSPLGFRKLNRPAEESDAGLLRVTSIPLDATVEFHGGTRENHDATELTFDAVPPGRYPIVVTLGGKTARAEVDVPKGSAVTVEVNFKTATITTIETKMRPRRLQVNDPNDALKMLDVPSQWKTAIRTALPSTVQIVDAYAEGNAVKVRLKVPSEDMAHALFRSVSRSSSFSSVEVARNAYRDKVGWLVDFAFHFAG